MSGAMCLALDETEQLSLLLPVSRESGETKELLVGEVFGFLTFEDRRCDVGCEEGTLDRAGNQALIDFCCVGDLFVAQTRFHVLEPHVSPSDQFDEGCVGIGCVGRALSPDDELLALTASLELHLEGDDVG